MFHDSLNPSATEAAPSPPDLVSGILDLARVPVFLWALHAFQASALSNNIKFGCQNKYSSGCSGPQMLCTDAEEILPTIFDPSDDDLFLIPADSSVPDDRNKFSQQSKIYAAVAINSKISQKWPW